MDFTKIFNFMGDIPSGAKYAAALIIVLILILFVSWVLKKITEKVRIGGRRGGRLKVQESIMVDASRTLTLIKCDNVEHLILLSGTNDLVVASNILKTSPVAKNSPMTVALAPTVQAPTPQPMASAPVHTAPPPQPPAPPMHQPSPLQAAHQPAPAHTLQPAPQSAPAHTPQLTPVAAQMATPQHPVPPAPNIPHPTHYRPQQQAEARPLPTPAPRTKVSAPPPASPHTEQREPTLQPQVTQADTVQTNGEDSTSSENSKSPSLSNIRPGDEK